VAVPGRHRGAAELALLVLDSALWLRTSGAAREPAEARGREGGARGHR
jgi:hypothetical protein